MQEIEKIDPYKDYIRRLLRAKGLDTPGMEPFDKTGKEVKNAKVYACCWQQTRCCT